MNKSPFSIKNSIYDIDMNIEGGNKEDEIMKGIREGNKEDEIMKGIREGNKEENE